MGRGGRSICTFIHIIGPILISTLVLVSFSFPRFLLLMSLHPLIIVTIRYAFSFSSSISSLFFFSLGLVPPMLPIVIRLQSALIPPQNSPEPPSLRLIMISSHLHFLPSSVITRNK